MKENQSTAQINHRLSTIRPALILFVAALVVVLAACAGGGQPAAVAEATPIATVAPALTPTPVPTDTPAPTATFTPTPIPTPTTTPSPEIGDTLINTQTGETMFFVGDSQQGVYAWAPQPLHVYESEKENPPDFTKQIKNEYIKVTEQGIFYSSPGAFYILRQDPQNPENNHWALPDPGEFPNIPGEVIPELRGGRLEIKDMNQAFKVYQEYILAFLNVDKNKEYRQSVFGSSNPITWESLAQVGENGEVEGYFIPLTDPEGNEVYPWMTSFTYRIVQVNMGDSLKAAGITSIQVDLSPIVIASDFSVWQEGAIQDFMANTNSGRISNSFGVNNRMLTVSQGLLAGGVVFMPAPDGPARAVVFFGSRTAFGMEEIENNIKKGRSLVLGGIDGSNTSDKEARMADMFFYNSLHYLKMVDKERSPWKDGIIYIFWDKDPRSREDDPRTPHYGLPSDEFDNDVDYPPVFGPME